MCYRPRAGAHYKGQLLMDERFDRSKMVLGEDAMARLAASRVAVFGVGGVGGYVVEALARSGVGALDLIDCDRVSLTNINRQIIALGSTVGRLKTEVAAERVHDINPECVVTCYNMFFTPETAGEFAFEQYDYVVDAIDTVAGKIGIIECAKRAGVPVISSMGAGNKTDPTLFKVADISKTSVCPLAKAMRRELKARGIKDVKVVYSEEIPAKPGEDAMSKAADAAAESGSAVQKKYVPGSVAFVPSVVGLIIGGVVVKELAGE